GPLASPLRSRAGLRPLRQGRRPAGEALERDGGGRPRGRHVALQRHPPRGAGHLPQAARRAAARARGGGHPRAARRGLDPREHRVRPDGQGAGAARRGRRPAAVGGRLGRRGPVPGAHPGRPARRRPV
ncbi:MAG: hypothetical protein AVDCRST_MAG79-2513, partial [uncultured Thermoleophilia bacterium]